MARILIIDDSPTEIYRLSEILTKQGHELTIANNGAEGFDKACEEMPDLILMDVVMPKVNGFQATRKLSRNQKTKDIPVVLVTTKNQETDRIWGKRQGAKDYLTKPVDEQALINTVNELLS